MKREASRRQVLKGLAAGLIAGSGLGVYSSICTDDLEVVHRSISLPLWTAHGFRVGLLADLHLARPWALTRAERALELLSTEKVDVILIAGDMLSSSMPHQLELLKKFLKSATDLGPPVVAVLGNHDYRDPPASEILVFKKSSATLLRNEAVEVDGVMIVGFDDALFGNFDPNATALTRGASSSIGLLHEPDFVDSVETGLSLVLSGHSHGGQMCLPTGAPVILPYGGRNYVTGYFPEARSPLYVTRGVGTMGPAIRTFCRPEVTVLTLVGTS